MTDPDLAVKDSLYPTQTTMEQESRRSFIKKSIATSASLSFVGLIRAHGQTIPLDPFEWTIPQSNTVDPWDWFSGGDVTDPPTEPACPPHVRSGLAYPYALPGGGTTTAYSCGHCGQPIDENNNLLPR